MSDLLPLTNDKDYDQDQDFDGSEFEYVMAGGQCCLKILLKIYNVYVFYC